MNNKIYWRTPHYVIKEIRLLILLLLLSHGIRQIYMQSVVTQEDSEDGIEIIVESTAHSLKFSLNDTDNYQIQDVICKSVKGLEEIDSNEHSCDNLDACTTYRATLTIKNLNDEEATPIEKTVDANTDYTSPVTEICDIETFVDTILLNWLTTDISCVNEFVIEVKSVDKDFKWTVSKDKSQLLIEGLNPCQEHNIQLKTFDINGLMVSNLTTVNSTEYAEPGNVSLFIEPYENAQVRVYWESPQYRTCINYYFLTWTIVGCLIDERFKTYLNEDFQLYYVSEAVEPENPSEVDDTCKWSVNLTDSNAKEYIITNLQGCEDYNLQMFINNATNAKSELENFTAPEQVPGVISDQTSDVGSTNITLYWNSPSTNAKCVKNYRVQLMGPLQRLTEDQWVEEKETVSTQILFDGLDPCGIYNISIWAVSLNSTLNEDVKEVIETLETQPTAVQNCQVNSEPHALTISWEPPAFADLCLSGYRLTGWKDEQLSDPTFDQVTNNTNVRVDGLFSCISYTVQIIPQTKSGMDGELKHVDAQTDAIAAAAPNNFQAIGLYPNSLELSAQDADVNNKCGIIFARFVCELSKSVDVPYKSAERYVEGQVGGISFKASLSPLSPYTDYRCDVALFNIAGWSQNKTLIKKTEPYFPDPPAEVVLKAKTNISIGFGWSEPKYANGNIKLYILHFQVVKVNFYTPPSCSSIVREPIVRQTSSLEQSFTALLPYTIYSIQVAAENEYGVGEYTKPYMGITDPWTPASVTNLKVLTMGPYESDIEYQASVIVSWIAPCRSNGEIEFFELDFLGDRIDYDEEHFKRSVEPNFNSEGGMTYNETNLKPEFNYIVSVVVKNKNYSVPSSETKQSFVAPAGIPKKLDETAITETHVNAYEANNPTKSAVVRFPASILDSDAGTITYVAILLSEKQCNSEPQMRYGALNSNQDWPDVSSWNDVYESNGCITEYQTTPLRWKPISTRAFHTNTNTNVRRSADEYIEYTIGTDNCESINPDSQYQKMYCNGPLKADTEYHMILRLFTNSGYNDAALLEFKTDSLIQLTLILVSVCSCLLLAFIAGFIYFIIAKRKQSQRQSCHGIEDAFGDVVAKNFAIYYREISKPDKIAREFKELTLVAMDLSTSASELGTHKNRYADIFPYDKNRVILDIDTEGSDYINASFIDGYRRKKEYIATQGPKPESTMDFWRMVLQHNVRIIVMVTQFREGDAVKCHEYFPYKSKGINVTIKKKEMLDIYDRTEMSVTHENYGLKQKVVHFYFKKWPDHGCPIDPMHLITFIKKVKAEKTPSYSPVVVHCSAGVGRTGTFIGLDIIIQRLKSESKINIYETVKKLRFQRMKMVQTLTQYRFLYACAYEMVKHKNKNTRSASKYDKQGHKKVSFQGDKENNSNSKSNNISNKHRNGSASDLNSIDENENGMGNGRAANNLANTVEGPNYDVSTISSRRFDF